MLLRLQDRAGLVFSFKSEHVFLGWPISFAVWRTFMDLSGIVTIIWAGLTSTKHVSDYICNVGQFCNKNVKSIAFNLWHQSNLRLIIFLKKSALWSHLIISWWFRLFLNNYQSALQLCSRKLLYMMFVFTAMLSKMSLSWIQHFCCSFKKKHNNKKSE